MDDRSGRERLGADVQTFLPFPSFSDSARALDRQRLGRQRVEAWQILRALTGDSRGWANHPATKMWRGHIGALARYGAAICAEWRARGYRDTMLERFDLAAIRHVDASSPSWLGDPDFHRSHQSNLIRKLPEHYGPIFGDVPADLPYVWPRGLDSPGARR